MKEDEDFQGNESFESQHGEPHFEPGFDHSELLDGEEAVASEAISQALNASKGHPTRNSHYAKSS